MSQRLKFSFQRLFILPKDPLSSWSASLWESELTKQYLYIFHEHDCVLPLGLSLLQIRDLKGTCGGGKGLQLIHAWIMRISIKIFSTFVVTATTRPMHECRIPQLLCKVRKLKWGYFNSHYFEYSNKKLWTNIRFYVYRGLLRGVELIQSNFQFWEIML